MMIDQFWAAFKEDEEDLRDRPLAVSWSRNRTLPPLASASDPTYRYVPAGGCFSPSLHTAQGHRSSFDCPGR
jgi:hypothetical protein